MQFLVTAYDGKDSEALARRMKVREQHLSGAQKLFSEGRLLQAAAILNEEGGMAGSVMLMDFAGREELDQWLSSEPYVLGDVWREIRVERCAVAHFE